VFSRQHLPALKNESADIEKLTIEK